MGMIVYVFQRTGSVAVLYDAEKSEWMMEESSVAQSLSTQA